MTTFEWPGMTVYVELILHSNNSFGGCASQMHWVPVTPRKNETNQIQKTIMTTEWQNTSSRMMHECINLVDCLQFCVQ